MPRLVVLIIGVAILAHGFAWLADQPGTILVHWGGYELKASVFHAVVLLAFLVGLSILTWSMISALWRSPATMGAFFNRRRQLRGLEALSGGMIAIGAGDRNNATRFAVQARKALPNEPMTQLLRAQAAQLSGDRATSRRMFEAMLTQPETEQLGLRGLFLEAEKEGENEAARQFAERSVDLNPQLGWAVDALFELQCKDHDWAGALATLGVAKKHQHHDKPKLDRRRAVLMTARAQALEETDPNRAMALAVEAHHLAHNLVPAAVLAGRMLAARGHTKRAAKIIERAWRLAPHPDLAFIHAHVRPGDSPHDRLQRVKRLAQLNPHSIETPIAIATAAIEAKDWAVARSVLEPLDAARQTQRVCTLMARIEGEENGNRGGVREWLARAVHAPRDPAWVAGGVVSDKWSPVSPVTGAFDAFEWKVPADALDGADSSVLAAKLDELVRLGAPAPEVAKAAVEMAAGIGKAAAASPPLAEAVPLQGGAAKPVNRVDQPRPRSEPETNGRRPPAPSREAEDVAIVTGPGSRHESMPRPVRAAAVGKASVEVVTGGVPSSRPEIAPRAAPAVVAKPEAVAANKPLDASMFIAPRAPDDPGPDGDTNEPRQPPRVVASGQR